MADNSGQHADDLETLARRRFGELSEAEERLVRGAPKGETAYCGPSADDSDPGNDPTDSDHWGHGRVIRGDLITWLCVAPEASKRVDPRGFTVHAAKVEGKIALSLATIPFSVFLFRCRLADEADLTYVKIPQLYLDGSRTQSLLAEGAEIEGNLLLSYVSVEGEVRLIGAQIGGTLNCEGSVLRCSGGKALAADRIRVEGGVNLRRGFRAEGEVALGGARVGGDLSCRGGTFKNLHGYALFAENIKVGGSVFLDNDFGAYGNVDLSGAKVEGSLDCRCGMFDTLDMNGAEIKGAFAWAQVRNSQSARLDLRNAEVGSLMDDQASWPKKTNLLLDGFVYERISSILGETGFGEGPLEGSPTDARTRLEWLDRQPEFRPQPYHQLAKILRDMGDDGGARQVLFELESRTRAEDRRRIAQGPFRWLLFSEDAISRETVGYGIYPMWAVWYLCGLTALGWIVHRRAQRVGAMAPTEEKAYAEFHNNNGTLPDRYQPFNPLIYSLENCIPLVKLGQDERWQPDPNPQRRIPPVASRRFKRVVDSVLDRVVRDWAVTPAVLRWFRWIMIGLGWLLATFFVAGLTGIIKVG